MRAADQTTTLSADQERAADSGLKAMMPIAGRSFLEYLLSSLADAGFRDVGIVVGPDHRALRQHFEESVRPRRVRLQFLVQPEPLGTANAVLSAEEWIGGENFICLNADNLYPVAMLKALADAGCPSLLAFEASELAQSSNIPASRVSAFAVVTVDGAGNLSGIIEKPRQDAIETGALTFVSMNGWRFDSRMFAACRDVARSARGEFELPDAVQLALTRGVRFRAIQASGPVLDLSSRADVADVARRLAGVVPRP
jgi:glucose-1-phosphate thymidylyltransferase